MTHIGIIVNHYKLLFSKGVYLNVPRPFRSFGNRGFTLVELIVVTAIIGLLALITIPFYMEYINKTKNARAIAEIRTLSSEISAWIADNGGINPTDLGVQGINRKGLKDPWNHEYIYNNFLDLLGNPPLKDSVSINYNQDFDVYSVGADGVSPTPPAAGVGNSASLDDIIRSNDGSFVGLRAE